MKGTSFPLYNNWNDCIWDLVSHMDEIIKTLLQRVCNKNRLKHNPNSAEKDTSAIRCDRVTETELALPSFGDHQNLAGPGDPSQTVM